MPNEPTRDLSTAARAARPRPPRVGRRSQGERRAATRARLLAAAIESLARDGLAGTTTTRVCARAGVSQGALFKHFPSKGALLASAAEQLFAGLIDEFRDRLAGVPGEPDRAEAAVRGLHEAFAQPRLAAAFVLYVAARTDAELAERLAPVAARHAERLHALARDLFPAAAARDPGFAALVSVTVMALQGAALGRVPGSDASADAPMLGLLVELVRRAVE